MFNSVLTEQSKKNLKILSAIPLVEQFYLAGGTGCALHLGHRISKDLDFFSKIQFVHFELQESLKSHGDFVIDYTDTQTLIGRFNTTKISFFHYDYPLIRNLETYLKLNIASLKDSGCMKIDTISSRGKKRDFVDLFFILNNKNLSLKKLFQTTG